jgi:hypothetical protein
LEPWTWTADTYSVMSRPRALSLWLSLSLVAACAGVKPNAAETGGRGGSASGATGGSPVAGTGAAGTTGTTGAAGAHGTGICNNLECDQTMCMVTSCTVPACGELEGPKTTLSGTIYDPAGSVPLYNVAVYIPNKPLDPVPEGLSCQQCNGTASGQPIASALTDATGHFTMDNPPVGTNIPMVIQVGKWRREVIIPEIDRCTDNVITDIDLTRLPRNQSEGHLPQIAFTTGHSDAVECLLRKIGISDSEFTPDSGTGRVHMYWGGDLTGPGDGTGAGTSALASGGQFASAATLWGSPAKLANYDIMILSCEGSQYDAAKMPYLANIKQFADRGGRIFDDHLHFYWIYKGLPPWPATADWIGVGTDLGDVTGLVDTTFAKGAIFSSWLSTVGASTIPGQVPIVMAQHSVSAAYPPASQQWIYTSSPTASVQYLDFNTPVEAAAANQCGRVVFTDIHVSAASGDSSNFESPFPTGCTSTTLSPQEKALEFIFFDLASCVQNVFDMPMPPIIVP